MGSCGSKMASLTRDMPPALLLHPSLITPPPTFPLDPLVLHYQSQNCPFQGFFGACMG